METLGLQLGNRCRQRQWYRPMWFFWGVEAWAHHRLTGDRESGRVALARMGVWR